MALLQASPTVVDDQGHFTGYTDVQGTAQFFTTVTWTDKSITSVTCYFENYGSPTGTMTAKWYDSAGVLKGTLGTLDISTISTSAPTEYTFDTISPVAPATEITSENGDYLAFMTDTAGDQSNYAMSFYSDGSTYSDQLMKYTSNSGGSWSGRAGDPDLCCAIYGTGTSAAVPVMPPPPAWVILR